MRKRNVDMLNGNLYTNVLLFALPLIASGIIQLLFNAIDMIVVGQFSGSNSMAAVSSTGSLVSLVTNLFIGLSVGSSVCIAKRIGSGNYESISEAVQTSITIALIFGGILMFFGILFSKVLLEMMKSPADVIDLSTLYLRVYFTGMPATMVYNFASAVLRAKGDTKRPLIILSVAGLLNALLNLFFVVTLKMDVAGVALASSISTYVSAIMVVIVLVTDPGFTRLDIKDLHVDINSLKEIATVGIPAGIQSTLFSLSNVVIQSSINEFGGIVMAANGAASSIGNFIYTAMNSFQQTCLTFTSQNLGAKKIDRIKSVLLVCSICVTVIGLVLGIGAYTFGETLLGFYTKDKEVIASGMIRLLYVSVPYFMYGLMDVIVGALRGIGSSIGPMIVSLMGICVFRLVWVATYFKTHHTIEVLYASYPISWVITALVQFVIFVIAYSKMKKKMSTNEI